MLRRCAGTSARSFGQALFEVEIARCDLRRCAMTPSLAGRSRRPLSVEELTARRSAVRRAHQRSACRVVGPIELRVSVTRRLSVTRLVAAELDRLWVYPVYGGIALSSEVLACRPRIRVRTTEAGRRELVLTGQAVRRMLRDAQLDPAGAASVGVDLYVVTDAAGVLVRLELYRRGRRRAVGIR
jgi:hypothetical protein